MEKSARSIHSVRIVTLSLSRLSSCPYLKYNLSACGVSVYLLVSAGRSLFNQLSRVSTSIYAFERPPESWYLYLTCVSKLLGKKGDPAAAFLVPHSVSFATCRRSNLLPKNVATLSLDNSAKSYQGWGVTELP